ncbi:MAG: tetratricopeptide repeat protein, partial [Myxococcales bacterium]|nr:tetratricopeptide repeat protein [Myxococcales bacterium]
MRTWLAAAVLATSAVASPARAEDAETALRAATARVQRAAADVPSIEQTIAKHRRTARTAEKQIADAVLLMGVKDYDRAADVLNQVVERYKDHPTAFADGLNLLGETYFESKQYLSARRVFDRILDDQDKRFAPYRERAAIRLVDVALRLKEFDTLDDLFAR